MAVLVAGIVLWWAGHLFKRVAPEARARLGDRGKLVVVGVVGLGVVLIILGYRGAAFVSVYDAPSWGWHVNNLLMLFAVVLFGTGNSKSPLRSQLRHPMLGGLLLWAIAHLLANGDLASVLLFGSMAVWSVTEMRVINAREPGYEPWQGGTTAGTIRLILISVAVYAVLAAIHTWLGYRPFL